MQWQYKQIFQILKNTFGNELLMLYECVFMCMLVSTIWLKASLPNKQNTKMHLHFLP